MGLADGALSPDLGHRSSAIGRCTPTELPPSFRGHLPRQVAWGEPAMGAMLLLLAMLGATLMGALRAEPAVLWAVLPG